MYFLLFLSFNIHTAQPILLCGINPLALETAKNLVLMGFYDITFFDRTGNDEGNLWCFRKTDNVRL